MKKNKKTKLNGVIIFGIVAFIYLMIMAMAFINTPPDADKPVAVFIGTMGYICGLATLMLASIEYGRLTKVKK